LARTIDLCNEPFETINHISSYKSNSSESLSNLQTQGSFVWSISRNISKEPAFLLRIR
jgi:hypothetical protein